jgi:hypothetical protein
MLTYLEAYKKAFAPEEVIILVSAFDDAWQAVLKSGAQIDGNAELIREALAKHIIESARGG